MNLLDVRVQAGFCQIRSHKACEYLALKMIVYHLSIGYNSSTHIQARRQKFVEFAYFAKLKTSCLIFANILDKFAKLYIPAKLIAMQFC